LRVEHQTAVTCSPKRKRTFLSHRPHPAGADSLGHHHTDLAANITTHRHSQRLQQRKLGSSRTQLKLPPLGRRDEVGKELLQDLWTGDRRHLLTFRPAFSTSFDQRVTGVSILRSCVLINQVLLLVFCCCFFVCFLFRFLFVSVFFLR